MGRVLHPSLILHPAGWRVPGCEPFGSISHPCEGHGKSWRGGTGSSACWVWGQAARLAGFTFIPRDSSGWARAERALSTASGTIREKASLRGISP